MSLCFVIIKGQSKCCGRNRNVAPKTPWPCSRTRSGQRRWLTENSQGIWNRLIPLSIRAWRWDPPWVIRSLLAAFTCKGTHAHFTLQDICWAANRKLTPSFQWWSNLPDSLPHWCYLCCVCLSICFSFFFSYNTSGLLQTLNILIPKSCSKDPTTISSSTHFSHHLP